ncbi:hypothetical protein TSUD_235530 [Trifolium subterraneum]|nr:hypothetical protein TSUD_235530 [Trifolium subterraneum]
MPVGVLFMTISRFSLILRGLQWGFVMWLGDSVLLTSHPSDPLDVAVDLIWHNQVPLNVSIFAWRLLRDMLPTKTNLAIRGIITPAAQLCVAGCGDVKTTQHLFISCSIFGSLRLSVMSWIGLSSVDPQNLSDHFLQFTFSSGGLGARLPFFNLFGPYVFG